LAAEVNASASGLEGLIASLTQTLHMLDRLIAKNESMANQAMQKIELTLDNYTALTKAAYIDYQQAVSDLEYAEKNYEDVPDYYYKAVDTTEREHNRLLNCCKRLNDIKTDFDQNNANCQKLIAQYSESYSLMVGKGNAFVEKYIEVLNRSNNALSGVSATGSGVSGTGKISNNVSGSVQSIQSIAGWLGSINPKYNNPFTPKYRKNCGSCAIAVDSRLSGKNNAAFASAKNIPTDSAMEQTTGKKCVYMSVQDISNYLIAQGTGSHLIVGINRHPTPFGQRQSGHWFNAYYDGTKIYTVDGQSGKVYPWPHDYVDVSAWCALI